MEEYIQGYLTLMIHYKIPTRPKQPSKQDKSRSQPDVFILTTAMKKTVKAPSHKKHHSPRDSVKTRHLPNFFNPPPPPTHSSNPQPRRKHISSLPALPAQNSHMPPAQSVQQILRSMKQLERMGEEKTKEWLDKIRQQNEEKKKEEEFRLAERRIRNRLSIISKKKEKEAKQHQSLQLKKSNESLEKSRSMRLNTFEPLLNQTPSQLTNSNQFLPTRQAVGHPATRIRSQQTDRPSVLKQQHSGLKEVKSPTERLEMLYLHSPKNKEVAEKALQLVKRIGRARRLKRRNPTAVCKEQVDDKLRLLGFLQSVREE